MPAHAVFSERSQITLVYLPCEKSLLQFLWLTEIFHSLQYNILFRYFLEGGIAHPTIITNQMQNSAVIDA